MSTKIFFFSLFLLIPSLILCQDYSKEREEAKIEIKEVLKSESKEKWNSKEIKIVSKLVSQKGKIEPNRAKEITSVFSSHISYKDFNNLSDYKKGYFLSWFIKDYEYRNPKEFNIGDSNQTPLDLELFMNNKSTKKWTSKQLKEVTTPSIKVGKLEKKDCKLVTKEISKHINYNNFQQLSNFQKANLQGQMGRYIMDLKKK